MRTPVAWANVLHNKRRAAVSLSGVMLALLLVFMQLGFYDCCFRSATLIFDQFDFDIALVCPQYVDIGTSGSLPMRRLAQAEAVDGVAWARPMYVGAGIWKNPIDSSGSASAKRLKEILVIAIDPANSPFREPALVAAAPLLKADDTAIVDVKTQKGYAPVHVGTTTELEGRTVKVVATYGHGIGFVSDAGLFVSDRTFSRLFAGYPLKDVSLGLVKLRPGTDVASVVRRLQAELPDDVRALPRPDLEASERHYFVDLKPLGIMFSSGVVLAMIVGCVILYQILASDVMSRLKEYATLEAIGYSHGFAQRLVLQQVMIFAVLGFIPATLLALVVYTVTRVITNLPMFMTLQRVVGVLILSVCMCCGAGLLVIRKLAKADPAELF